MPNSDSSKTYTLLVLRGVTYLSDLDWTSATAGDSAQNNGLPYKDRAWEDHEMAVLGTNDTKMVFAKGIGTHAASTIAYDITEKNFASFYVVPGVSYAIRNTDNVPELQFSVLLDGVEKYKSAKMTKNTTCQPVEVDVTGGKTLTLVVTDFRANPWGSHANWADAQFRARSSSTVAVSGVTLDTKELTLPMGGSQTLVATVTPENATNRKVRWSSGDEAVASVDQSGRVTAIAAGVVDITVTAEEGQFTGVCKLTVSNAPGPVRHTVTFNTNGGSTVEAAMVDHNTAVTQPRSPVRRGYTFTGWYSDADLTKTYDFATLITGNITLYAKWSKNSDPSGSSSGSAKPSVSTSGSGGKISASSDGTATITPDAGYAIAKITINGKEVPVPANGKLIGLRSSDKVVVTFEKIAAQAENRFTDVSSHWAKDAIGFVVKKGLFSGTGDTTFSPEAPMTRAMLMTVLARMNGQETGGGATWYEKGMNWAQAHGISDGTNPDGNITREQFAAMLYRYAGAPDTADLTMSAVGDANNISDYAKDAMLWATQQGIVTGKGEGVLDPMGTATRAEVATMLQRFLTLS